MKNLLFLLFIPIFLSCQSQDCSQLPKQFTSHSQAVSLIRKATFKIKESANTTKSSWIRGAEYFSCDGKTGYFILVTDSKSYIHKDMTIEVWKEFKNADSFGSYYNLFIKNKWQLVI